MLAYRYQMTVSARSEIANRLKLILSLAITATIFMLSQALGHTLLIGVLVSCSAIVFCVIVWPDNLRDVQLHIDDNGALAVIDTLPITSLQYRGSVSPASYATAQFCLLKITVTNQRSARRLLIWKDSLDDRSFRRLSRIIRLARHQI